MNTYSEAELGVIAANLVNEGGYRNNPLMDKSEIRNMVSQILEVRGMAPIPEKPKKDMDFLTLEDLIKTGFDAIPHDCDRAEQAMALASFPLVRSPGMPKDGFERAGDLIEYVRIRHGFSHLRDGSICTIGTH